MLHFLKRKKNNLIGIDISASSIKLLELSRAGSQYRVEAYASVSLPPDVVVDKVIRNTEVFAQTLKEGLTQIGTGTAYAAVAIADSLVITKMLAMEKGLTDYDIETQIGLEAEKYIPYPLEEVSLDFTVLGDSPTQEDLMDVLLVACRSNAVSNRVDALVEAGLSAKVVDVESYAVERACRSLLPQIRDVSPDHEYIACIFDIGGHSSNMTVLNQHETIYTREESFGGELLIAEMCRQYGYLHEEALACLQNNTLQSDFEETILNPHKDSLVLHLRRSLQFFFSASHYNEVNQIILAGGSANIPGITDLIEDQLGIKTSMANPFQDMLFSSRIDQDNLIKSASSLMLCCGLALRSFD